MRREVLSVAIILFSVDAGPWLEHRRNRRAGTHRHFRRWPQAALLALCVDVAGDLAGSPFLVILQPGPAEPAVSGDDSSRPARTASAFSAREYSARAASRARRRSGTTVCSKGNCHLHHGVFPPLPR